MAHDAYSSIPPSGPGGTGAPPIPWEAPGTPAVSGFVETIKLFVTRPSEAYARMPLTSDIVKPLIYVIVIGWIASWISFAWSLAFEGVLQGMIPGGAGDSDMEGLPAFLASGAFGLYMVIFYPVILLVALFIASAITHLFLMLVGGANNGYFATFRTLCYGSGTASLASLIPICGGLVDWVWGIVLGIIGLSVAHQTSKGKAALAVLLPGFLICLCVAIGSCVFGAALFGAFGNR